MLKRLPLIIISVVLFFSLLPTSCSLITGNNIATVESIEYHMFDIHGDGVSVNLKPSSGASANVEYTVDLYESGRFRDTQTVSWNESELQVSSLKQLIFILPDTELDAYIGDNKNSNDVFSVKIYDAVKSSSSSNSSKVITFIDTNLQNVIRKAINKPTGKIYLSDVQALTQLDANSENITNLSGIEYCTNLTSLDLLGNQISNISPLASLKNLNALYITSNKVSDISPLASLTNLDSLYLEDNQISDIAPLSHLTRLTRLGISDNLVSNISPLASLTGLRYLDLHNNHISDISSLHSLVELGELSLSGNQINNISPLASLNILASLDSESNQIADISALASLHSLVTIDLINNKISNMSPLVSLTKLKSIYITNNPLSVTSINTYIPQLINKGVKVNYSK